MSFILNGVTLKQPSQVNRTSVEIGKDHVTLDGVSKRDIVRQKEAFTFTFTFLTQIQVAEIVAIYNLKTAVSLVVSELSINTTVWVKIQSRTYEARGTDFRETMILTLEEV